MLQLSGKDNMLHKVTNSLFLSCHVQNLLQEHILLSTDYFNPEGIHLCLLVLILSNYFDLFLIVLSNHVFPAS